MKKFLLTKRSLAKKVLVIRFTPINISQLIKTFKVVQFPQDVFVSHLNTQSPIADIINLITYSYKNCNKKLRS
jgi:hypothetical protein